jgi:hypothetical protein
MDQTEERGEMKSTTGGAIARNGATALPDPQVMDQLCDALMSRLEERFGSNCLLSSRFRVRVSAGTPPLLNKFTSHFDARLALEFNLTLLM